jgi:N6-L-threonylcarbamoyladenine synthase
MIHSKDLDFSFSGLKSSIRRLIESQPTWSDTQKQQLAREFEDTVTDTVVAKVREALTTYGAQTT